MRWWIGISASIFFGLAVYAGSAIVSLCALADAAQSGDGPEIMARTNLPRVKRSLVDQIVHVYLERIGEKRPLRPIEKILANTAGASIADAVVTKMLTEENLTKLLNSGGVADGSETEIGRLAPVANIGRSVVNILKRTSPVKLVEFAIRIGEDEDGGSISMHFEGDGWKLSGVNLPNKTRNRRQANPMNRHHQLEQRRPKSANAL
jgi:Protein of unknown function (DUF2939)